MNNRDLENQQRDNFHAGVSPDLHMPSASTLKGKPKPFQEKKEVVVAKNFDVNFISDEDFKVEQEYFPIRPHSDLILVVGPRVENSTEGALKLDEKTANDLLNEKLNKLGAAFRVIAISQKLTSQDMGGIGYTVGDYVTFQSPLRLLKTVSPDDSTLAYYEVRNIDVKYSMTQTTALKFKPVSNEA